LDVNRASFGTPVKQAEKTHDKEKFIAGLEEWPSRLLFGKPGKCTVLPVKKN
jgi:hypothetical protein